MNTIQTQNPLWIKLPKAFGRSIYNRCIHLSQMADEPYATHIPILIAVTSIVCPENVVEFGAGVFSTLSFARRDLYPSIRRVVSYENDREWYLKLKDQIEAGSGLELHYADGPMHLAAQSADLSKAAMIFIDDSSVADIRSLTVDRVAARCNEGCVVVLHDSNLLPLRRATRNFQHRIHVDALNPQTSILWNGRPEWLPLFREANRKIGAKKAQIAATDMVAWKSLFTIPAAG
jgi:hypothetical protein